jgi:hypothetical protein
MLSIKQCLAIMHSGAVFSIKVVSYDKRRKDRRGRVIYYPEARLVWGDTQGGNTPPPGERPLTELEKSLVGAAVVVHTRKPNHKWHYTRNIRVYDNGTPTETLLKIHPPLIIEFNGQITTP